MAWSDTATHDPALLRPLTAEALTRCPSVIVTCGPTVMRLRTDSASLRRTMALLYAGYPGIADDAESVIADFTVEFRAVRSLRAFGRKRLALRVNGGPMLSAQSEHLGFALFEWAANWCVATFGQEHLAIHAAVIERNGRALLLPGPPGSGKSTLCAIMVARGWRLLTDETALLRLRDGMMVPVVRPISLKNRSIDIMRELYPQGVFGPSIADTEKGTVAHLRPPEASIAGMFEPVPLHAVLFPTYVEGEEITLTPYAKAQAFMFLASNSFNYDVLGAPAFDCLTGVIGSVHAQTMRYGDATAAAEAIEAEWP